MKKTISIIAITVIFCLIILTGTVYGATLDALKIETDKNLIRPGEETTVTINFGTTLGAYTFDIAYDKNIFEYVSVEGGTANDTKDKVRVTFYDALQGRTSMSIKFRAKSDIKTSNPTEFTVTGEGLANKDASVTYDDIKIPIVKNVTVEPEYIDYTLKLEHTGEIIKKEEKEMKLSYSSPIGKHYEHARLVASAKTPSGATVKLLGTDQSNLEHDIIQSGWGDAQGYKIGGKDFAQVLNVKAIFSEVGEYAITLKLIDRDSSDATISEKTFNFKVAEKTTTPEENKPTPPAENQPEETKPEQETRPETKPETKPETLPKTGINAYLQIAILSFILVAIWFAVKEYSRKRK